MLPLLFPFLPLAQSREITFPPSSGYASNQVLLNGYTDPDISAPKFAGLETFANLPYVHCLGNEEVEEFDIAVLGAPFDTVSLGHFGIILFVASGCVA
jgi:agmatinase